MQNNIEFINLLKTKYPNFIFKESDSFSFHPPHTIKYCPLSPNFALQTLHELGHGLLSHKTFKTSLERLKIERKAWNKAQELCRLLDVPYDEAFVEDSLDSYRNWLHKKTTCKKCGLTCYQTPDKKYHCPRCDQ